MSIFSASIKSGKIKLKPGDYIRTIGRDIGGPEIYEIKHIIGGLVVAYMAGRMTRGKAVLVADDDEVYMMRPAQVPPGNRIVKLPADVFTKKPKPKNK